MPVRIEELIRRDDPLAPMARGGAVLQRFLADPGCTALALVHERTALGVIHRATVFDRALSLGLETFAALPAAQLAEDDCFIASGDLPIGRVALELARQKAGARARVVLVTQRGAYLGLVEPAALFDALAEENGARAGALRQARQQTDALRQRLAGEQEQAGNTLARFAHEVRTPLTAILGLSEQLRSGAVSPPQIREAGAQIATMTQELARLSQRVLDTGALSALPGRIVTAPVSVKALLNDLATRWRPVAQSKGLALHVEPVAAGLDRIEVDVDRFSQIAANLISNAIKYTPSGSITLSARIEEQAGTPRLVFKVADTGPGIAANAAGALFKPFSRLPNETTAPGAGLGLHICKTLAQQLSGTLTHGNAEAGGSVFTLTLPVRPAGPRLAAQGPLSSQRRASLELGEILLVEDHGPSRAILQGALVTGGWKVEAVGTLAQARRRLAHKPFQAVLCDIHLVDGEGSELVREARNSSSPNRDTLWLAITADSSAQRMAACKAAGFSGVLTKPLREGELVTGLIDHLTARAHRSGDAVARAAG